MKVHEIQGGFGLDHLTQSQRPEPEPGPREVVVKVRAASLNYRDLIIVKGQYNPRMPLPRIPLSDGAGEIVAVGADVTHRKVGDRVCGLFMPDWVEGEPTAAKGKTALGGGVDGMLTERIALPETGVIPIPDHLSFEEAATLPCAAVTAWNALMTAAPLTPGQTVLLQGTGGVSIFALQFARLAGARIILTSSSDAKLERGKDLGAHETINYKTKPDWEKTVLDLTDGIGVDHVVEVGGPGTLGKSFQATRVGGHVSLIGVLTTGEVNPIPILMKSLHVRGIYVGSGTIFAAMNRAFTLQQIHPVIDRTFDFDDIANALRHLESGTHFGKIAIQFPV